MTRNLAVEHDTEDKNWWCHHGEQLEKSFVTICRDNMSLDVTINPEKVTNPYAPDLIFRQDGITHLADLKTQNTPFFTSSRYGADPRYTVTFNRKDYERYKQLYPDIVIFFWLDWKQTTWNSISTKYLAGIFKANFADMAIAIESGKIPEHAYQRRTFDVSGNAKTSFLFDVRDFQCLFKKEGN